MADFLLALADFDQKKLWRDLGHASLFSFLRRELGLSAGAAQYRKTAAELVQKFPEVEAALRDGQLCLSSVIELAKVLTPENRHEVLPRFFGLSRREAEAMAVSIRPVKVAPRREVVTMVRAAVPALIGASPRGTPQEKLHPPGPPTAAFRPAEVAAPTVLPEPAPDAARQVALSPAPRDSVEPLDGELSRFHVTVSRRFLAKLEATKDALSHARRGASTEEILEAGLDLLLAEHAKRKGLVEKPRKDSRPMRTDAVPAHVKRAVWIRAGGRCEWRFESGEVCGSTKLLQFDHIVPRAQGGPSTIDNVRLTCAPHNLLAARRVFGDAWMDRYERKPSGADCPHTAPP
jgi:hypothetical protein